MIVIAHRGASWDEPENTLPAFERAAALGVQHLEVDVRLTPDGRCVAVHDRGPVRSGSGDAGAGVAASGQLTVFVRDPSRPGVAGGSTSGRADAVAGSHNRSASVGSRPVSRRWKYSVKVSLPISSVARSRPRTSTRSG